MLDITYYLLANPLIALGLAILVLLCVYNVLRRQVRVALGLWLTVLAVMLYVYLQAAAEYGDFDESQIVEPPGQAQ